MAALAMAEMTETRLDRLESDVAHIRSDVADLKADVRELRKEIGCAHEKISNLGDRVWTEIGNLRSDMHKEIAGLRDDMRKEFAELHKELAANSRAILRGDLTNRIWMLLMGAAILGVLARGLHWL
ncbi:MAG TPA: hypothetical protein VF745_00535 [Steroidobacteraceae bacterium]